MSEVKRFDSYNEDNDMIEKLNGPYVKHTALEHLLSLKDIELDTLKSELSAKDLRVKELETQAEKAKDLIVEFEYLASWAGVDTQPYYPRMNDLGIDVEELTQQHTPKSQEGKDG